MAKNKTEIHVTTVFDGELDATDVFVSLISQKYGKTNTKEYLAKQKDISYKEALNHAFDEPKQWEIREINEIMNQCIDRWRYFPNPRMFSEYGRQKGWERENPATDSGNPSEKTMDGFVEVTEQMELPF